MARRKTRKVKVTTPFTISREEMKRIKSNRSEKCRNLSSLMCVKSEHLFMHASLGFMEYHIVDILFHTFTGTDATHYIMGIVGLY
jgi:hypothetical protein